MKTAEFADKKVKFPSCWNDFSKEQIGLIARYMVTNMEMQTFKTVLTCKILRLEKNIYYHAGLTYYVPGWRAKWQFFAYRHIAKNKAKYIASEDLFRVTELLDFMFKVIEKKEKGQEKRVAQREIRLTKQHFPVLKAGRRNFYGPAGELADACAGEFIAAENYYDSFLKDPQPEALDKLCASLYRPRKRFYNVKKFLQLAGSDKRADFSDDTEKNHTHFQKIPLWQKFAILMFFEGVRNSFIDEYEHIYVSAEGQDGDATDDDDNKGVWPTVITAMAGHVLKIEPVLKTNVHNFLFSLNEKIKENKRLKQQTQKK